MLRTPLLGRCILVPPWQAGSRITVRRSSRDEDPARRADRRRLPAQQRSPRGRGGPERRVERRVAGDGPEAPRRPSLIEQLFPEETRRYEEARRHSVREIPRLPLDHPAPGVVDRRHSARDDDADAPRSPLARRLYDQMQRADARSTHTERGVLVLRNASLNLTEDDFKRLVPQGRHMEGWTLERGDILQVVPGRDLATLEQKNYYYLLFSSQLSAFTYQGHATRIFRLVQAHMPSSVTSPIPPPPGYLIEGMDAHAAIAAFALLPPSQNIELRQLRLPLSPMVEAIVRSRGYPSLVKRKDKMPFEVRLTFDGPQLQASAIRHILHASGKERALSWSGGDEVIPKITKWEPRPSVSPTDQSSQRARDFAAKNARERSENDQMAVDVENLRRRNDAAKHSRPRAAAKLVYIVGFYTEGAALRFIAFWHQRPMEWKGVDGERDVEEELPPIANAEMLW